MYATISQSITSTYSSPESLKQVLLAHFSEDALNIAYNELTLVLKPSEYIEACVLLKNTYQFEMLIDLCGVDYLLYKADTDNPYVGCRYAVVVHLLSVHHNVRLRVKCYLESDTFPLIPSLKSVWSAVNWYEREAFDLFGIMFEGHPDLRRILTDYGFIGHPLRKDFPVSGTVEMRYDEVLKKVIYQPITIEPRENTPRVIRESGYAGR